jgi:hypothetical protein
MRIIAFGHRRRTGKNLCASIMRNYLKSKEDLKLCNIVSDSIAFDVKDTLFRLFAWAGVKSPAFYEVYPERKSDYLEPLGMTVRELMIEFATKLMRKSLCNEVWINSFMHRITLTNPDILIVTDLRFLNEVEKLSKTGATTFVKVTRSSEQMFDDDADSELKDWDGWDEVVTNEGTIEQLVSKVYALTDKLFYPKEIRYADTPSCSS